MALALKCDLYLPALSQELSISQAFDFINIYFFAQVLRKK
jgi:hypothetical protein